MATNTIAGVNLAAIAEESLDTLLAELIPVSAFTTDFSTDIADKGASITTRYPSAVTAVDLSNGYTSQNTTLVAKTITLDKFYGFPYGFKDTERSKSSLMLNDLFIRPAAQALGKYVLDTAFALIDDTSHPASSTHEMVSTAANFGADDVADLAENLSTQGVPRADRSLILGYSHYGNLSKDSSIAAAYAFGGSEVIRTNNIPTVRGFNVYEYPIAANGVNMAGFACGKQSILLAARGVDATGASQMGVEVVNMIIPGINLPVQFRRFYDPRAGELVYSLGVLFGVALGTSGGTKIVTS